MEQDTSTRIRDVAMRLFAARGYAATSVRTITSAASLTPGALYNHYDSKEAILNAIVLENHQRLLAALKRAWASADGSATDALDKLVNEFALHATHNAVATLTSENEHTHLAEANRKQVLMLRRRVLALFESVIANGVASGEFILPSQNEASARLTATSIVNMCVRIADSYDETGTVSPEDIAVIHRELARRMTRSDRSTRGSASTGA